MPNQLGSVIGYPGFTPDQQVLQQRLQSQQGQGVPSQAPVVPSYGSGSYPGAQAYDYSPPPQPSPSPKMSNTGDESGTKKALKARQTKLGETYPAVDPSE